MSAQSISNTSDVRGAPCRCAIRTTLVHLGLPTEMEG